MATVLKLGPADRGRRITLEEFMAGDYEEGFRYELIDGKLYVSPQPDPDQSVVEQWAYLKLQAFSEQHPDVLNFVWVKARVFVPARPGVTNPEPDVAAYHDFPLHLPLRQIRWQDTHPILVVEVLGDDPEKDLTRNVELYFEVPTIKEYWVIDIRANPDQPDMRVHRRWGKRWKIIDLAYGDAYTTKLLPGFTLTIDPRH